MVIIREGLGCQVSNLLLQLVSPSFNGFRGDLSSLCVSHWPREAMSWLSCWEGLMFVNLGSVGITLLVGWKEAVKATVAGLVHSISLGTLLAAASLLTSI